MSPDTPVDAVDMAQAVDAAGRLADRADHPDAHTTLAYSLDLASFGMGDSGTALVLAAVELIAGVTLTPAGMAHVVAELRRPDPETEEEDEQ